MCGFAGILNFDAEPVNPSLLKALSSALEHRGPDDVGYAGWTDSTKAEIGRSPTVVRGHTCALVHRRLSIIDLSRAGWQPMVSPNGKTLLVYNGEIYNYRELRNELKLAGYQFETQSDTEVLLKGYQFWGEMVFPKLTGMFSVAILDSDKNQLVLGRDHFGIKPLYWWKSDTSFAFGSEAKAFLEMEEFPREINAGALATFLGRGLSDYHRQSFLNGLQQVPAGSYLVLPLDKKLANGKSAIPKVSIRSYWRPRIKRTSKMTFGQAAEQMRELFIDSVRLHLRSDVPLGACLSGGIDSSSIVMAVAHLEGKNADLTTFSYIAEDESINEEAYSDLVSEASGYPCVKVRPNANDFVRDSQAFMRAQDFPVNGASMYAQYRVYQAAHDHGLKVVLDGQGADEVIAGYQGNTLLRRVRTLLRSRDYVSAIELVSHLPRFLRREQIDPVITQALSATRQSRPGTGQAASAIKAGMAPQWLDACWLEQTKARWLSSTHQTRSEDFVREELVRMLTITSLPHLLRTVDRNSMVHSVEARVPFLTQKIVDFSLSLPEQFLVSNSGYTKHVFREAMRGIVPDSILDRTDKIGFSAPVGRWLTEMEAYVRRLLQVENAKDRSIFNPLVLEEHFNLFLMGRAPLDRSFFRCVSTMDWLDQNGFKLA